MIKIKGTSSGLRMILDSVLVQRGPEEVEIAIRERLQSAAGFLESADLRVEIASSRLDPEMVNAILRGTGSAEDVRLLSISTHDGNVEAESSPQTEFHFGNIRSGQTVSAPSTLVVLGNVNPGGRAVAVGDLYVTGSLGGFGVAGAEGDASRIIYAGKMDPLQIRIGEAMARGGESSDSLEAECAAVDEGRIAIFPAAEVIGRRSHGFSPGTADQ